MYIPTAFAQTDKARLHDAIGRYGFAILTSQGTEGLVASHLPLLLDAGAGEHGLLLGHMARANPQWRNLRGEALAIFSGPHAYVSPAWYEEPEMVPTWNYVAVHAYGTFQVVEDQDRLLDILRRMVHTYESPRPEPWLFDEAGEHVERLLRAIVGFQIVITRLEGKWKLNQNHPPARRQRVLEALLARADHDSQAVASLMEELTE